MIVERILLVGVSLALPAQLPATRASQQPACAQALAEALTDGAAGEICAGDEAARLANTAPRDGTDKTRQWLAAAGHYRRAATLASKDTTKLLALNSLANAYDAQRLNDLKQMETVLREIMSLAPDELAPVFRLAKLQEDEGFIDAAEGTLLDARHRQPDDVEPNRMLAQFYARRVTALHQQGLQQEPPAIGNPGEADGNGVYRIGEGVTAPVRVGTPQYPPDARAAGISGTVAAEIVVDPSGNVTDARVVRSIPLLDEAALRAVRSWQYAPTVVNGLPVPVKMIVTVNFTLPTSPAASAPPRR